MLALFSAKGHLRGHSRPVFHRPYSAFLDADPISQLHRCLPAETTPLQVVAVLHGKQKLSRILKERA